MKTNKTTAAKKGTRKPIYWALGIGAAGALTYLGYLYYKRKQQESSVTNPIDFSQPPSNSDFNPPATSKSVGDTFPLKKGSSGPRVKALQSALMAKYGTGSLPKYGADGTFGSEVITALAKAGYPSEINESAYSTIISTSRPDPAKTARAIHQAILAKNFSQVNAQLQAMQTTDDYSSIGAEFLKLFIGGVRKTLVNGLLDASFSENQKQQIRLHLTRMGLRFDGSKWSLSGLGGLPLITQNEAVIWKDAYTPLTVPKGVILGNEVAREGEKVWFEQGGSSFLVKADGVGYLNL